MLRLITWTFYSYSLYSNVASFLLIRFPQLSYRILLLSSTQVLRQTWNQNKPIFHMTQCCHFWSFATKLVVFKVFGSEDFLFGRWSFFGRFGTFWQFDRILTFLGNQMLLTSFFFLQTNFCFLFLFFPKVVNNRSFQFCFICFSCILYFILGRFGRTVGSTLFSADRWVLA